MRKEKGSMIPKTALFKFLMASAYNQCALQQMITVLILLSQNTNRIKAKIMFRNFRSVSTHTIQSLISHKSNNKPRFHLSALPTSQFARGHGQDSSPSGT